MRKHAPSKAPKAPPQTRTLLWKGGKSGVQESTDKPRHKYDLKWHNQEFNPWEHGYIWKSGAMWYRRPDGVDVRAQSGVNEFDEYGELIPVVL